MDMTDELGSDWFRCWYDANRSGIENMPHEQFSRLKESMISAFREGFRMGRDSVTNVEPYNKNKPREATGTERNLYRMGRKLDAIKKYRERLGAGLPEAYCAMNSMTEQELFARSAARLS